MRTNIEIDDALLAAAMKATGKTTKRETVERCLRDTVERAARQRVLEHFGKVDWQADYKKMRRIRHP